MSHLSHDESAYMVDLQTYAKQREEHRKEIELHILDMDEITKRLRRDILKITSEIRGWEKGVLHNSEFKLLRETLQHGALQRIRLKRNWLIYRRAMEDYHDLLRQYKSKSLPAKI